MSWHDGVPLTAHDVAFTYGLLLETREPALQYAPRRREERRGANDRTVVIVTAARGRTCSVSPCPSSPSTCGRTSTATPSTSPDPALHRLRTVPHPGGAERAGPAGGERRVSDALGGRPALDVLDFVVERDPAALVAAYRAGVARRHRRYRRVRGGPRRRTGDDHRRRAGARPARVGVELLEQPPERWQPPAARPLGPPRRALGRRRGEARRRRRRPASPSPVPHCSRRRRSAGAGRSPRPGVTGTTPCAPSGSWRTPATPIATGTACARMRRTARSPPGCSTWTPGA